MRTSFDRSAASSSETRRILEGTGESPPPRYAARVAAVVGELRERVAHSAWLGIGLKTGAAAIVLLVLAWIGGQAAAHSAERAAHGEATDAASAVAPPDTSTPNTTAGAVTPESAVVLAASTVPEAGAAANEVTSQPAPARASPSSPVYLNQATERDLQRLPGVGAKRAQAIVALRQRVGRFQRLEELLRVKGVGRRTLTKWRPLVRLDAPVPAPDAPDASPAG